MKHSAYDNMSTSEFWSRCVKDGDFDKNPKARERAERFIARAKHQESYGGDKPIRNLAQFTRAAFRVAAERDGDARLQRAPTGAGETAPQIGGFLVPATIAEPIFETIFSNRNSPLSYFRRFTIPDGSAVLQVPGVDETSRADGLRWGGIVCDFIDEGVLQTIGFPKVKQTTFAAEKLIALVPLSNELLADVENLQAYLVAAISDEIKYKLEQYALGPNGTGAGKPLSALKSTACITVAAETGQKTGTILKENIDRMWNALPAASRSRAIWAAGEGVAKQVFVANQLGAGIPLTYPVSGSATPDDPPRLNGRPFLETDTQPAVGTFGDLLLIDPAWYGIATKPMAVAMSGAVAFLSDQAYLRVVLRCDGNPLVSAPLTASDGSKRSPFVALAARP